MNVLFLTPRFPPSPGGAETYAQDLTRYLPAEGWNPIVVTYAYPIESGLIDPNIHELGIELDSLDNIRKVAWRVLQFGLLDDISRIVDSYQSIDLVHVNSIETAIAGRVIADSLAVPLVATIHEHAPQIQSFGKGRCKLVFERLEVDRFIAPSRFYYERALENSVPKDRVAAISHGICSERLRQYRGPCMRQRFGLSNEEYVLLFVGRIYAPKGLHVLLDAIKGLNVDRDWKLVVAGPDGPDNYTNRVKSDLANHPVSERVCFTGELSGTETAALIESSDLMVIPSLAEGFGLVAVEAMHLGTPIIASEVGGLKEILSDGKTALLFQPEDVDELIVSIERLIKSADLAEGLARSARLEAVNKYSSQRMARETAELYSSLLD